MYVASEIQDLVRSAPDLQCDVIVAIDGITDATGLALGEAGLEVTSEEMAEAGIICGRIRPIDIRNLESVAGIESVELDSTQYAL